ncbi:MAG: hypothetical protein ABI579_08675 [Candidatus Sumerlaeota bacterium]
MAEAQGPSPLSPADGAIFQVGEPILIEQEFKDGCAGGTLFQTPSRTITMHDPALPFGEGGAELVTETVSINLPGTYNIRRICTNQTFHGEEFNNRITIEETASACDPIAISPGDTQEVPRIQISVTSGGGERRPVLTLDNSFNKFGYITIKNMGTGDLVLIDIQPWVEFESFKISPVGFVPYTVVRPGHVFYVGVGGTVLKPNIKRLDGFTNDLFFVKSNDPELPIASAQIHFQQFETQTSIPTSYQFPLDPPTNPATPKCADLNGDGVVDSADIVGVLAGR